MARASTTTTTTASRPWWAAGGDEVCSFCLQSYHYVLEYRCAGCDEPLCPSCGVRVSVEVVELHCPDCGVEGREES